MDIFTLAEQYDSSIKKEAAKDKVSRKRLSKDLERAKAEYGKLKDCVDELQSKKSEIDSKLAKMKADCGSARKEMLRLHKTMQSMDISNATDAVFYQDDTADVGYLIQGKEFYLDIKDDGEIELIPMLQHRKNRKMKQREEASAMDGATSKDDNEDDEELNLAEDELESLYHELTK